MSAEEGSIAAKRARTGDGSDPGSCGSETLSASNTSNSSGSSSKNTVASAQPSSNNKTQGAEYITRTEKLQHVMRPANVLPGLQVLPCVPPVSSSGNSVVVASSTSSSNGDGASDSATATSVRSVVLRPKLGHSERFFRRKLVFPDQDDESGDTCTTFESNGSMPLVAIIPSVCPKLVALGYGNRSCRILTALVLPNDLCVLVAHRPLKISTLRFDHFDVSDVSGKKKKGAKVLQAGSKICTLTIIEDDNITSSGGIIERLSDGTSISTADVGAEAVEGATTSTTSTRTLTCELKTPVGGQVLELNRRLETHPELLANADTYQSLGYIAIIFPDTELPDFHTVSNFATSESINKTYIAKAAAGRQCFAWNQSGACSRGNLCKFEHSSVSDNAN